MTIILICPKCKGNAWLWITEDEQICYDCRIPMVDSATQQVNAVDELRACAHTNMLPSEPHGFLYCPDCGLRN